MTSTQIKERIRSYFDRLASYSSLESTEVIDAIFVEVEGLLELADEEMAEGILVDPVVSELLPHFRQFRNDYEYNKERYWANRIAHHRHPALELKKYPDLSRNESLVNREFGFLSRAKPIRKALFVGCGPLPITPMVLFKKYGVLVDCVEIKEEAYLLAQAFSEGLELTRSLRFIHADVLQLTVFGNYDVVFVAALVGNEVQEKSRILRHIGDSMRDGATLVARTGFALRRLFYSEINLEALQGFNLIEPERPPPNVIASAVIAVKTVGRAILTK